MPPAQLGGVVQHIRKMVSAANLCELGDAQLLQRFIADRDETAFATLVRRHGKLVWSICWQVLHHEQDVEDAFQATFLVLARHAGSIRQGLTIPSWLYRVAHRTALGAERAKLKRRALETRAATMARSNPSSDYGWRDLQVLLAKEVDRLPEKYRAPFLLCCLEGKTKSEAAKELGWREGTVSSRLARARERLRDRLSRRGVELSAVLGAAALTYHAAAAVPLPLTSSTIKAGLAYAAGKTSGLISAKVATLTKGATKAMFLSKIKMITALFLTAGLAIGGAVVLAQRGQPTRQGLPLQTHSPKANLLAWLDTADRSGAEPVKTEPLRGTVYAADGSPAAGAVVWAAMLDFGLLVRQETVADAKGRYALNLAPGRWEVWARRGTQGGEGPAHNEPVEIAAGKAREPVPIHLEERGTFRGRLLQAETNKPIPDGRLFVDEGLVLTTDGEGRFEVGGLYRGNHESYVVAPGRMRMRVLFDTTARVDTELDVPVPRVNKIVGRVTDLDGKPIKGAYVGRYTSGSCFSTSGLFLACDADGRFEYDDAVPPDQPTRLAAAAPGYDDVERDPLKVSPDGKPLELHFRLSPKHGTSKPGAKSYGGGSEAAKKPKTKAPDEEKWRTISGIVRGPDEKPVSGVVVRWGYQDYVGAIQTRTDAAGRFRLTVPDEAKLLAVLPRDFLPEFLPVDPGGDKTFEVALATGNTVAGRVLDDTGKPIKDVQVIAVIPSPDPRIGNPFWLSEPSARTNAEGKFQMKGVPASARFDFLKSGTSDVRNHELVLGSSDNTVTLLYGGAIGGRVVDRNGKPIRNFRVLVGFPRERRPDDKTSGFFAGYSGIGVRFTSADGSFVLTGVGAGSVYRITALADGHGEAVVDRVTAVPVNRLATTKAVTLQAGPPVALRVRAVTANDKLIAGARVTLVNGEPGLDQTFSWGYHDASWEDMVRGRTGADGWADFPALSFASATILVQAPGYGRHRFGWRDKQKELSVQLAPEAIVTGEVRDPAGKPMNAFYVNLMSGGDQIAASVDQDNKGRFRIAELPAGTWSLTIRDTDGRSTLHQGEVTLKPGETKDLKIKAKKE